MDDVGRVNVKTTSQQLVHEVLTVIIRQILPRIDNSVHISLHQVSDNIDIFVSGLGWWFLHIHKSNDIFMVEEF